MKRRSPSLRGSSAPVRSLLCAAIPLRPACLIFALCAFFVFGFAVSTLQAKTFFVSPAGSDANPGTAEAPFATPLKARDAVRAFRASSPKEAVTVELAGGRYALESPLVFEPEDSGTAEAPITWQGAAGERAVLSGGRVLTDWQAEGNGLFSAPCSVSDPEAGTQLFVERNVLSRADFKPGTEVPTDFMTLIPSANESRTANYPSAASLDVRRAIRARAPNWNPEDATASYFWARQAVCKDHVCMKYRLKKGDLDPYVFDAQGQILPDVQFVTYQYWSSSFNRIASYESETGVVHFPRSAGAFYPNQHARWHVENCRAALDAPAEWYFDRKAGRVYYFPKADEDLTRDTVILSVCPRWLIETRGDWANSRLVKWLVFRNLVFSYADADLSPDYENSVQAAHTQRGAFNATGMAHSRIEDCEFSHLGENGISLVEGSAENVVTRNHVFDVGAGGICLPAVPTGAPDDLAITRKNRIENNLIHHTGAIFHSACGIFFGGMAQFNFVTHNEISDSTWAGMQYGWSWGSGKAYSNHNDVGWNHIHHISNGVMNDLAGIYTLGDTDGSRLHHNWIHDVNRFTRDSIGYGGWGLYTDAGTSNLTMDHNLIHDTQDGGLHIHNYSYPYHTIASNNIFAYASAAGFARNAVMSTDKDFGVAIEKNVNFNTRSEMLSGSGFTLSPEPSVRMNRNCYWSTTGEPLAFLGRSFAEWKELSRLDAESIVADPRFMDPANRDFRLAKDSPLPALGFEPFDLRGAPSEDLSVRSEPNRRAGLYGDAAWVRLAALIRHRPLQIFVPGSLNEPFTADFEDSEPDELPFGVSFFQSQPKELQDSAKPSVSISEEQAFSGKKSLKVLDAPNHQNSYDPHVITQNVFPFGQLTFHYALRVGTGCHLQCETRQYSNARRGYETGPCFQITPDGKIVFAGQTLTRIPLNEWVEFSLHFPSEPSESVRKQLEEQKKPFPDFAALPHVWTLDVRTADGQTKSFGPFPLQKEFRTLEWFAVLSLNAAETTHYLDAISVRTE